MLAVGAVPLTVRIRAERHGGGGESEETERKQDMSHMASPINNFASHGWTRIITDKTVRYTRGETHPQGRAKSPDKLQFIRVSSVFICGSIVFL
jgi:hypothetical protein